MKANRIADKQIIVESIFTILIIAVVIVGGYILFNNINGSSAFTKDDLLVDFKDDNTSTTLLSMNDSAGLKTNPYSFAITNNGKKTANYSVFIKPKFNVNIDYAEYLKISVDDVFIDTFDKLDKGRDGHYIIFKEELDPNMTGTHIFKLWLTNSAPKSLRGIKCDFEFGIESVS